MNNKSSNTQTNWLLFFAIVLLSFCLRPTITGVGPLIPTIRNDLNLSNSWAGFLTTLPLIAFATFSLFSSAIGHRLGYVRAIVMGLIVLGIGIVIRVQGGAFLLYFGTALTGIGIVICNVLLIPLIKDKLPQQIGLMTSAYTTGLSLFAAIGTGVSIPLAEVYGWRGSLLAWIVLIFFTLVVWIPQIRKNKVVVREEIVEPKRINVWKSKLAWQVSLFMGLQSFIFFTLITWLPELLIAKGLSSGRAGLVVMLMQIVGLSGTFLAPLVAVKFKEQTVIAVALGIFYIMGFSTLFFDAIPLIYFGLTLVGFSLGASISMAYVLIGLRTTGKTTADLSGMSQSAGYYLASVGPLLVGLLFDITVNWNLFILIMIASAAAFTYFGSEVGRDRKV
ncbi:MAG TPA: MFS transporter [Cyclobacteriaceae bacterium]|nr:MFS transporter [Cyclobacteriaceae bacterium]